MAAARNPGSAPGPAAASGGSPLVRTAWRVAGSGIAVVTLASVAWSAIDTTASRHETRTARFAAAPITSIVVDVDAGDVVVVGRTEATEITTEARLRVGFVDPTVTVRRDGATLRASASCAAIGANCLERLTITTPSDVEVTVTTESGDVEVRGLDRPVKVTTESGDVTADELGGGVALRSDNGDLVGRRLTGSVADLATDNGDIRLTFDATPTRVSALTDNGDVDVLLPHTADRAGVDFAVVATSDNGSVSTPIRTNPTSRRSVQATSDNGDVTVAYRP